MYIYYTVSIYQSIHPSYLKEKERTSTLCCFPNLKINIFFMGLQNRQIRSRWLEDSPCGMPTHWGVQLLLLTHVGGGAHSTEVSWFHHVSGTLGTSLRDICGAAAVTSRAFRCMHPMLIALKHGQGFGSVIPPN